MNRRDAIKSIIVTGAGLSVGADIAPKTTKEKEFKKPLGMHKWKHEAFIEKKGADINVTLAKDAPKDTIYPDFDFEALFHLPDDRWAVLSQEAEYSSMSFVVNKKENIKGLSSRNFLVREIALFSLKEERVIFLPAKYIDKDKLECFRLKEANKKIVVDESNNQIELPDYQYFTEKSDVFYVDSKSEGFCFVNGYMHN